MMSIFCVAWKCACRLAQFGFAILILMSGHLAQAGPGNGEGKIGWYYYTGVLASPAGFTEDSQDACGNNAWNHFRSVTTAMRPGTTQYPHYDCYYKSFMNPAGWWYGVTDLFCEPGYEPTWPDLCLKWQEVPRPAPSCPGEPMGQAAPTIGNPVVVSSGSKLQFETDFNGSDAGLLKIVRTYRSMRQLGIGQSAGYGWSFSFDRAFQLTIGLKGQPPSKVSGTFGDGSYFEFKRNTAGKYVPTYDSRESLKSLNEQFDDWALTTIDGTVERFSKSGDEYLLVSSHSKEGRVQYYRYDAERNLADITDDAAGSAAESIVVRRSHQCNYRTYADCAISV